MKFIKIVLISISLLIFSRENLLSQPEISAEEFQSRRSKIMARLSDGILLLHARSVFGEPDQLFVHGFQQNPSFYYFTGLESALNAILAIDGVAGESRLFVPDSLDGLASLLADEAIPSKDVTESLGLTDVETWDKFSPYLDQRIGQNPELTLYVDEAYWPGPQSNPEGLLSVADPYVLWRQALQHRWPAVTIKSAKEAIIEQRLVKSQAEIGIMRDVARLSAKALLAGIKSIGPGRSQREVEAAIVCECIYAGGEGPSFWPWVMSGPNAVIPKPLESFVDYYHLNRVMHSGELVRVDVGCDAKFYKGDVGRTVPVSGQFSDGQRETWSLLVEAYRAGLNIMRDGTAVAEIADVCVRFVGQQIANLETELAKKAAEKILRRDRDVLWHLHGSGLEAGEGRPEVLRAGMVVEFEPMFAVNGEAFYLEDMILITETGHEVLTKGLPYSADEIENVMRKDPSSKDNE